MTLKTFYHLAGWVAALLILGSYGLLSFGRFRHALADLPIDEHPRALGFIIQLRLNGAGRRCAQCGWWESAFMRCGAIAG